MSLVVKIKCDRCHEDLEWSIHTPNDKPLGSVVGHLRMFVEPCEQCAANRDREQKTEGSKR